MPTVRLATLSALKMVLGRKYSVARYRINVGILTHFTGFLVKPIYFGFLNSLVVHGKYIGGIN